MRSYTQVPLGEICTVNPQAKKTGYPDETIISFIPMAAIDERAGIIAVHTERHLAEVSKGYTSFENGDILFAKITPCMENGKVALARNLANGIGRGSTEFYVLRPGKRVLGEYIYHFVRQPRFREEAKKSFTGTAGQQRVSKTFMQNAPIPLPPLDEQRRIVSILNRAAKIERLQKQAQERLREFIPALFIKMFGDPIENPMGWERATLGELSQIQGGLQVTRKRKMHPLETPYLRVANVLRNRLDLREVKSMRVNEKELTHVQLMRGDLLIVEGHGNPSEIGRMAIWDGSIDGCVHQNHLIRVRPNPETLSPQFTCAFLNSSSGRQHLLRSGKTTSGLNTISVSDVKSCTLFTPPIDLQWQFTEFVNFASDLTSLANSDQRLTTALSSSLMDRLLKDIS